MRAILYARFSPRPNADETESIAVQIDRLRAYCMAHNLDIAGEYVDENMSGAEAENRPGLQRALDHVCRLRCTLCVYSLSRLARSARDAIAIAERLEKEGASLASLHESIDTGTPTGRFFYTVLGALAQMEREQIVERTSDAMQRHQYAGGRLMSRYAPVGYKIVVGPDVHASGPRRGTPVRHLEPDEAEREMMRQVVKLKESCESMLELSDLANANGLKFRGEKFTRSRAWHVLRAAKREKL